MAEPTSTPTPVAMPMQDQMADVKPDINDKEMEMLKGLMNEGGVVRQYQGQVETTQDIHQLHIILYSIL